VWAADREVVVVLVDFTSLKCEKHEIGLVTQRFDEHGSETSIRSVRPYGRSHQRLRTSSAQPSKLSIWMRPRSVSTQPE